MANARDSSTARDKLVSLAIVAVAVAIYMSSGVVGGDSGDTLPTVRS